MNECKKRLYQNTSYDDSEVLNNLNRNFIQKFNHK